MYNSTDYRKLKSHRIDPAKLLRVLLVAIGCVLMARLFYVQIVKHDYYQAQALAEHTKKFEIAAPRGTISFEDGDDSVLVVLNEVRYTIYADPQYITDIEDTANKLVGLIGGEKPSLIEKLSTKDSRYVVLAKKFTKEQADRIDALELKGIGRKEVHLRTYPQGNLAAQVLGFVNDDGEGQYGVEGYMNDDLSGEAGLEKAVTDVRGIPLAVNNDNILKQPIAGKNLTLTIDIGMQKLSEDVLKSAVDRTVAIKGNIIVMESATGAIKAMANYPSYEPSQFDKVDDIDIFKNPTVTNVWEPGSVIKPLLAAAVFTENKLTPESSYYDAGFVQVDDRVITNAFNYGAQNMSVRDIINKSLNTGAVFMLKSLGDGEINQQARSLWYEYLTNHYLFNQITGLEQTGEVTGFLNAPNDGDGLNVRYSNMAFGQGMSMTPIQLVGAYNAILNGGNFYKPTLIATTNENSELLEQESVVKASNIISSAASNWVKEMTKNALESNYPWAIKAGYNLGGKSGTAQVADGQGSYKDNLYIGTYIGYIADRNGIVKYVALVRLDEPKTASLASYEAAKVWAEFTSKLIDNFSIPS